MLFGFHPEKALVNAERLVQQGKYAAAIDIYEKLISQQSPIPNLKNNLGDLYVQVGRIKDALELFEEVVDYLEREGRQPRAIAVMRKMLKLNPDQVDLQVRLGRLLIEQGMIGESRSVWLDLLDRAERSGNWTLAEESVRSLLGIEPESLDLLARAAQIRQERGETARAQKEWVNLGRKAVERNALDSLDLALRRLQEIDPEWLPYRMLRARSEVVRGNVSDALGLLPADDVLRHDAGAAAEAWRIALDAEDMPAAMRFARIAMEAGDAGMAVAMGRELLNRGDLDAVVQWVTRDSNCFHRADLRGGWCTLLDDLLEIDPDHQAALRAWLDLAAEGAAAGPALAPRRQRLAELLQESGDLSANGPAADAAAIDPVTAAPDAPLPELPADLVQEALRDSAPPQGESILNLDDEWAEVANQDLDESIRQIEFFSQNGMLEVARQTLDAELARLPHEPRLQALDVVLRTRMEAATAAPVETAGATVSEFFLDAPAASSDSSPATEFSLSPIAFDAHEEPGAAASAPGLDWMNAPLPSPAPVSAASDKPAMVDAGNEDMLQEILPESPTGNGMPIPSADGQGEAAWAEWLQSEPMPPKPAAAPELKGRGGEAARLLDDLFDNFRTTVEGQSAGADSDPEHQYNMGIAYYEMGLFEEGVAELQKSFLGWVGQAQPPRDRLLSCGSTIALCFQHLNMPEMALDWYRRTIAAARLPASESIGLLYEEGRLLEQLGRREEALECYRQVYATNIDYQDVAECLKRVQTMAPPVA